MSSDLEIKSRKKTCSITCYETSTMPLKHCASVIINRRQCSGRNADLNRYYCSAWIWVPPSQTRLWHWKELHTCSRPVKDSSKPSALLIPWFLQKTICRPGIKSAKIAYFRGWGIHINRFGDNKECKWMMITGVGTAEKGLLKQIMNILRRRGLKSCHWN